MTQGQGCSLLVLVGDLVNNERIRRVAQENLSRTLTE
jgi:hypothetical protein